MLDSLVSANVFIFILFADRNVEKEFRVQIASAVGGRRGEGAYRKPLLRISRYSASEMDIFTEMDIFRKCKVQKVFLGYTTCYPRIWNGNALIDVQVLDSGPWL